jgi:hypothetical protein
VGVQYGGASFEAAKVISGTSGSHQGVFIHRFNVAASFFGTLALAFMQKRVKYSERRSRQRSKLRLRVSLMMMTSHFDALTSRSKNVCLSNIHLHRVPTPSPEFPCQDRSGTSRAEFRNAGSSASRGGFFSINYTESARERERE